jgi:plastocyanin
MKRPHRLVLLGSLLVLGAFAGCGGDDNKKNPVAPPTAADVTINITGQNGASSYSPNPANVTVGQTVAWKNIDNMTHTSTANAGAWNTGSLGAGSTSTPITMNTQGSFDYHCGLHPTTMTGTLTVNP